MKNIARLILMIICTSIIMVGCSSNEDNNKIQLHISAAASLKESMLEVKNQYEAKNDVELVINYGSSGSLKQQIKQGAPCDIFISAGETQVQELKEEGLLIDDTISSLVENKLVLATHKDNEINSMEDLKKENIKNIAMGEPSSVPVGMYADEALINLELKDKLEDKLVYAKDAKEVLAWVKSQNAEVGFVYLSDVLNEENIKIIDEINEDMYSKIIYPVAVVKNSKYEEESRKLEEFLLSEDGQNIFEVYGYKVDK